MAKPNTKPKRVPWWEVFYVVQEWSPHGKYWYARDGSLSWGKAHEKLRELREHHEKIREWRRAHGKKPGPRARLRVRRFTQETPG